MLLTLSAHSFRQSLTGSSPSLRLGDLPALARNELGLNGLVLQTEFLAGWDLNKIERLRDSADKDGAPLLLLVESEPQRLASADAQAAAAAEERVARVLQVAHRLGCSAVALGIKDPGASVPPEVVAAAVKKAVQRAERLELNLLLAPAAGLTESPERMTTLIRKVGGFRIGAYPDFEASTASGDAKAYLRALTPYASVVCASFGSAKADGLLSCIDVIAGVGFDQTVALEWRGKGDPREALARAKAAFAALDKEDDEPTDEEAPEDEESDE